MDNINRKYIIENIVINAKQSNLNISDNKLVRIINKLLNAILTNPNKNINPDIHNYAITKISDYLVKSYKKPQEECDQQKLLNSLTLVQETIDLQNNPSQPEPSLEIQTNEIDLLAANDIPLEQSIIEPFDSSANVDEKDVDIETFDNNGNFSVIGEVSKDNLDNINTFTLS